MRTRLEWGLAFLGVLILFGVLTLFFWNFVRDAVVVPIYYLLWVAGLTLQSLPQEVFLALLVCLCILLGLNTMQHLPGRSVPHLREDPIPSGRSRYQSWQRLCHSLTTNSFGRTDFIYEARQLTLAVLAFQEGKDRDQVEQMVTSQSLLVPETVRRLIVSTEILTSAPSVNWMDRARAEIRRWFQREPRPSDPALDRQVAEIIQFLQDRVEMNHEH